ncbi:MAG TPA: flagellar basal body L-ring protein FlgH [Tepidisphaeraceae bacterium]|jgi:flagellar L-ring protein precursor FlgH
MTPTTGKSWVRLAIVVAAMYGLCCAIALGQPAPAKAEAARPSETKRPSQAAPNLGQLMQSNGGSLLRAQMQVQADPNQAKLADVSFIAVPEATPRTIKKHDIVTIIVREQSEFGSKATTDLKKEDSIDARMDEFFKFNLNNLHFSGGGVGATPPSIKGSFTGEHKGEGDVNRTDNFTARISAEVLDVKPNGSLVLEARKQIKTDEEEQQFILTGACRAEDITPDNTILSTQLIDLSLQKNHKGNVRNTTKKGWLLKLLDAVSPF